jgi:serine/threonine protein kinase
MNPLLCDFGLAMVMKDGKAFMKTTSGTMGYTAPEVGAGVEVDGKIDIWSFGICLYEMAVAYKPSVMDPKFKTTGSIPFRDRDWRNMDQLKDLISCMLAINPEERYSALDSLKHPWFNDNDDDYFISLSL